MTHIQKDTLNLHVSQLRQHASGQVHKVDTIMPDSKTASVSITDLESLYQLDFTQTIIHFSKILFLLTTRPKLSTVLSDNPLYKTTLILYYNASG